MSKFFDSPFKPMKARALANYLAALENGFKMELASWSSRGGQYRIYRCNDCGMVCTQHGRVAHQRWHASIDNDIIRVAKMAEIVEALFGPQSVDERVDKEK